MIHLPENIFYSYARLADLDLSEAEAVLSEKELAFREQLKNERRRVGFTAGRITARRLAAVHLGCAPEAVPIAVSDDGSLHLEDSRFGLSLAHSREGVCAAVAENLEVGIDLEAIQQRHEDLYRYILHPEEYDLLDSLDIDQDSILILCWSIKEAVLKGMKTGFRFSPKKLRLNIILEQGRAGIVIAGTNDCWECTFEKRDNNYLAIAYPSSVQGSTFNV